MRGGILEMIVQFSEEASEPLESAITLIVGGFLVSGFVISKGRFFQLNPLTAQITEIIASLPKCEDEPAEPTDDGKRRFIHLRDAKYFVPGQQPIPNNAAVSCRIKLSDVSGFSFGSLAVAAEG